MSEPILSILTLVLAIGAPALIAFFTPRRGRLWAIAAWALAPLAILLAVAASEFVTGKASPADIDKLIFGVLLIASFGLLPWLMTCAVGYGAGALLRRRFRPEGVAAPAAPAPQPLPGAAPAAYSPPIDPAAPTLSPPSGWQAAHVGFDNDDLVLDGLPVWLLTWREEAIGEVSLAHPAHPGQMHPFRIFNIDDGTRAARFAAAELSNGVWGFYRWIPPADSSGESADGSLRYENAEGLGGRDEHGEPLARLYDVRSDKLLFDGAAWLSSRIVPQADGDLLLSLEYRGLQTIFRIQPRDRTFRDLAMPDTVARPLAELAEAAAAARAEAEQPSNAYLERRVSPDGSLVVDLEAVEWSNSHWVRSPRVTEIATGRVLLDLWGTDWDAAPSFPRGGMVRLGFRRYLGGGDVAVEIELAPERYVLLEGGGATFGPLRDLPVALEAASRRTRRGLAFAPRIRQRLTARDWLRALLILLGALAAIAVATAITMRLQPKPPPQRLDTVPKMPEIRGDRPSFSPSPPPTRP